METVNDEIPLEASEKPRALGSRLYSTDEDLIIMTGLKHVSFKRPTTKTEDRKSLVLPEFLSTPYKKISELHDELQGIIFSLEEKVDALIEREEKDFLAAYKTHLVKIQNELNLYRAKLDAKEFELKRDHLLNSLEQSLEFFKKEAARLAEIVSGQKSEIEKAKTDMEDLRKENEFLENQLKKAKKENKLLQLTIRKTEQQLDHNRAHSELGHKSQPEGSSLPAVKSRPLNYQSKFSEFIKCIKYINCSKDQLLEYCQKYYQELTYRHEEIESSLRQQLAHERKIAHKLRIAQTEPLISRTELEQLFYECAEEIRRNTINRRVGYPKYIQQKEKANKTAYLTTGGFDEKTKALKALDKVKIMEQFMSNEKLLKVLYDTVFAGGKNYSVDQQADDIRKSDPRGEAESIFLPPEKPKERPKTRPKEHRRAFSTKTGSSRYCIRNGKLLVKEEIANM